MESRTPRLQMVLAKADELANQKGDIYTGVDHILEALKVVAPLQVAVSGAQSHQAIADSIHSKCDEITQLVQLADQNGLSVIIHAPPIWIAGQKHHVYASVTKEISFPKRN